MGMTDFREDVAGNPEVYCQNCPWTGHMADVQPMEDMAARIAPGEIVPAGECPKCGALCQLVPLCDCCGKPMTRVNTARPKRPKRSGPASPGSPPASA
jgi:hypothetical protein